MGVTPRTTQQSATVAPCFVQERGNSQSGNSRCFFGRKRLYHGFDQSEKPLGALFLNVFGIGATPIFGRCPTNKPATTTTTTAKKLMPRQGQQCYDWPSQRRSLGTTRHPHFIKRTFILMASALAAVIAAPATAVAINLEFCPNGWSGFGVSKGYEAFDFQRFQRFQRFRRFHRFQRSYGDHDNFDKFDDSCGDDGFNGFQTFMTDTKISTVKIDHDGFYFF